MCGKRGCADAAVAGRDPPAIRPVALELQRVADRVLPLDIGRPPAVLEVVDPPVAHEGILDAAEVDPDVRELVGEERARVEELVIVDAPPPVGGGPGGIALLGERVGRRPEAEHVEQHGLVVAMPAIGEEAALRRPAVRDGGPAALRPAPVDAAVERVGERADLVLVGRLAIEVGGGGQHARQEERRVDGRELAPPGATARLHVEEVVVEPLVAGGVGRRPLRAVAEESQPGEHRPGDLVARDSPRSTRNGAVASAIPTAAMLAGDPFAVLSATSPFSRLTWWM